MNVRLASLALLAVASGLSCGGLNQSVHRWIGPRRAFFIVEVPPGSRFLTVVSRHIEFFGDSGLPHARSLGKTRIAPHRYINPR